MATVVFDFDSTLIQCESLEEILKPKLQASPEKMSKIQSLTVQGMNGDLDFYTSLSKRLEIAAPTYEEVVHFGHQAITLLSEGMEDLIQTLHSNNVSVWILSGGLRESILPVAKHLGIPDAQVVAVELFWDAKGSILGINKENASSTSKLKAAAQVTQNWTHPVIHVGDGMTDYELYEAGYVDHFIAYVEHVKRPKVLALDVPKSENILSLKTSVLSYLQKGA